MKNSLTLLEAAHKLLHNKMHEEEDFHSQRMISNQLSSLIRNASELKEMIDNDAEFPEWAQSEIAVAQSNIADVTNFMISNSEEKLDDEISEETKEYEFKDYGFVLAPTDKAIDAILKKNPKDSLASKTNKISAIWGRKVNGQWADTWLIRFTDDKWKTIMNGKSGVFSSIFQLKVFLKKSK